MTDTPTPEAVAAICPECNNTGLRDTGGIYPWGEGIFVPCDHNDPPPVSVTPEAVADLARRLRGEYRIPITDGLGAAGGEEPDNAHEFVRRFPSPPIQNDAAAMLEALAADLVAQKARADAAEAVVTASEKRRQAAQLLWDVLEMTNGAHDGMSRDEVEALWDAVRKQSGFGAVTAFLDALRGEGRS